MTKRTIILVIDSFGIGAAPDADDFGDSGADTLGHIAAACAQGLEDERRASGPLRLPHLCRLGLAEAAKLARGHYPAGLNTANLELHGRYAACAERSKGKDTPSGHWEMAGLPVMYDWGYFPPEYPSFPAPLIEQLIARAQLPGVLGNCHASGTVIIERLGDEHRNSGKPIVYTSADSVFQIAAHEESFGLERLYQVCEIARELVDEYHIGRVIARPFIGQNGRYTRTGNRRDYATPPHQATLLDQLQNAGREVIGIGKISDIFAGCGITRSIKANGTDALLARTCETLDSAPDGSLIFTNLVNFDSDFGHRRDIAGYAAELERFDTQLPQLITQMSDDDLLIITADHGCDPSWPGSDHTREFVPVLAYGHQLSPGSDGRRASFSWVAELTAQHLDVALD